MTENVWQLGWVVAFGWLTVTTAQTVLAKPPELPDHRRLAAFHARLLRPFGAVLTFVLAMLTVSIFVGLIQLALR